MMGNKGSGMNKNQMLLCDGFVKIKQYGGGTASLNVSVAAGIVLHRFHQWATTTGATTTGATTTRAANIIQ